MDMSKHTGRRILLPLCVGLVINSTPALADTQGVQEPLRDSGLRALAADAPGAEMAGGAPGAPLPEPAPPKTQAPDGQIYAMVNGKPITFREYSQALAQTLRERFYHFKAPEGQEEAVRKEVADLLAERILLVEEAERRGIKPDAAKIEQAVAAVEARYGASPGWPQNRERVLFEVREQVAKQSLLEQIKKAVRDVPQPAPAEVRAYYEQKPGLFTEPERLSLSVILLKVDPGAPRADWDKAREEAQEIKLRIKDGADFAEQARLHSGDKSAGSGGDLGYVHGGMLPEGLQNKIDNFQVGVVTEPVTMLEGVALYRLNERVKPVLHEFPDVAQRAQELLYRERQDQAWKETTSRLRGEATIEILIPIANDSAKQNDSPVGAQLIAPVSSVEQNDSPVGAQLIVPASSGKQSDSKKKSSKKKSSKKKSSKKMP